MQKQKAHLTLKAKYVPELSVVIVVGIQGNQQLPGAIYLRSYKVVLIFSMILINI